ncbi:hypothetical protein BO78DRAFT_189349 [Aspergillus sclerotiicarbonarius CBS 121057]|uniref:Uncharacterized protein n=1 Tax=Aspergillus sclerotiicarbonarius (strain CBS 121057 / IBT 28362) TaxID=1448318 RepID=A0A319E1L4_ASPSB|nr:hypothetical protein BO78DRAFT_189349 [Aspergillus sclerotiicarbonarius CBS 121057]
MPNARGNRFCHFCSRGGHTDSQCFYMTLCHGLYELALMISHRPAARAALSETQTALQRLVTRRQRNRRQRIRRRERQRARVNHPLSLRTQPGSRTRVFRQTQPGRQARDGRGSQVTNTGNHRPVIATASSHSAASSANGRPNTNTAGPSFAADTQATSPMLNQEGPRSPHLESVSSVTVGPVDIDITMSFEEPERRDGPSDASRPSNAAEDIITLDPLDTAEDERGVAIRGSSGDVVERYCGEIFTMI